MEIISKSDSHTVAEGVDPYTNGGINSNRILAKRRYSAAYVLCISPKRNGKASFTKWSMKESTPVIIQLLNTVSIILERIALSGP